MKLSNLFKHLQLFADGDGAAAGGDTGVTGSAAEGQTSGENAPAAEEKPDRSAEFEELIKGDYKDVYNAKVRDTVQKRLKGKDAELAKYTQLVPALDLLSRKYGTSAGDYDALSKAIANDDSYYEDMALEKGWSVEDAKAYDMAQREAQSMKDQLQQMQTQRLIDSWQTQAAQTQAVYPGFDMESELQNPTFASLIQNNVDVKTAYEVIHKDDIIPAAMQYTANKVKESVSRDIQARGKRPLENGMAGQAAIKTSVDPAKMTKSQRKQLYERALAGEKIDFKTNF